MAPGPSMGHRETFRPKSVPSHGHVGVELSSAAMCGNAPICSAEGKGCGSPRTPEFALAGRPATSTAGNQCASPRPALNGSVAGRRARPGSLRTALRAGTFLRGGSATLPCSGRRSCRRRRYGEMLGHPRCTRRCDRTSRERVPRRSRATVRSLEDLRRRHQPRSVAGPLAHPPARIRPR